jgi:hypothetical protein
VSSPSDGPLARALSHASPFKANVCRSGGSLSPAPRTGSTDAAGAPSSSSSCSLDGAAATIARIKLQDSLALSLNSPMRDKQQQQQQRVASAPSFSGFTRIAVNGSARQVEGPSFQLEQQPLETRGSRDSGAHGHGSFDSSNGVGAGGHMQGEVWRLSTDSEWWSESADAERPFTQSLGDRDIGDTPGSGGVDNGVSSGRSASSGSLGRRVQVTHQPCLCCCSTHVLPQFSKRPLQR